MVPLSSFTKTFPKQDGHTCAVAELGLIHVKRYF